MDAFLEERLEVMALGEQPLYGDSEELLCTCKGRGQFIKCKRKIPRLPWKAMMVQMAISDEESDGKRGRGRARMLRDHCSIANRNPGSHMVTSDQKAAKLTLNKDHLAFDPGVVTDMHQVSRVQDQVLAFAESQSETSTSQSEFKKPRGTVRKSKIKFRKLRAEDLNPDISSRSSDLDVEPMGTRSDRSEHSGIEAGDGLDHNSPCSFEIEKPVRPKVFKKPFDLAKANQSLLSEFPIYKPQQKIMTLTTRNLEKFTRESDKQSLKSGEKLNPEHNSVLNDLSDLPIYEKFAVTLDDIRISRMTHKNHNVDVVHTDQNLDPLVQAMDTYLSQSNDHRFPGAVSQEFGNTADTLQTINNTRHICNNSHNYEQSASAEIKANEIQGNKDKDNEAVEATAAVAYLQDLRREEQDCVSDISNLSSFTNPDLSNPQFSDEICLSDEDMDQQCMSDKPENHTIDTQHQCLNQDANLNPALNREENLKPCLNQETNLKPSLNQKENPNLPLNQDAKPSPSNPYLNQFVMLSSCEGQGQANGTLNSVSQNDGFPSSTQHQEFPDRQMEHQDDLSEEMPEYDTSCKGNGVIFKPEHFSDNQSMSQDDAGSLDGFCLSYTESMDACEVEPVDKVSVAKCSQCSSISDSRNGNTGVYIVDGNTAAVMVGATQNCNSSIKNIESSEKEARVKLKNENDANVNCINGVYSEMETDSTSEDTKANKVLSVNDTNLYHGVVAVNGTDLGNGDGEGFHKVLPKHLKKKTPSLKERAYIGNALSKQMKELVVWRLYGKEVIQVDGLPWNVDIDHLLSMVNAFGMIKDYQVQQNGEGQSSVRFRLEDADACEFACQCLHDSECVLPESSGRVTCVHLS